MRMYNEEQFITAWQSSSSLTEVKERLGYKGPLQNLSNRAAYFRRLGIKLKDLRHGVDIAKLSKIMDVLNKANWGK